MALGGEHVWLPCAVSVLACFVTVIPPSAASISKIPQPSPTQYFWVMNYIEDAAYILQYLDSGGIPLNSNNTYRLTFAQPPPSNPRAFWSIQVAFLCVSLLAAWVRCSPTPGWFCTGHPYSSNCHSGSLACWLPVCLAAMIGSQCIWPGLAYLHKSRDLETQIGDVWEGIGDPGIFTSTESYSPPALGSKGEC